MPVKSATGNCTKVSIPSTFHPFPCRCGAIATKYTPALCPLANSGRNSFNTPGEYASGKSSSTMTS